MIILNFWQQQSFPNPAWKTYSNKKYKSSLSGWQICLPRLEVQNAIVSTQTVSSIASTSSSDISMAWLNKSFDHRFLLEHLFHHLEEPLNFLEDLFCQNDLFFSNWNSEFKNKSHCLLSLMYSATSAEHKNVIFWWKRNVNVGQVLLKFILEYGRGDEYKSESSH